MSIVTTASLSTTRRDSRAMIYELFIIMAVGKILCYIKYMLRGGTSCVAIKIIIIKHLIDINLFRNRKNSNIARLNTRAPTADTSEAEYMLRL